MCKFLTEIRDFCQACPSFLSSSVLVYYDVSIWYRCVSINTDTIWSEAKRAQASEASRHDDVATCAFGRASRFVSASKLRRSDCLERRRGDQKIDLEAIYRFTASNYRFALATTLRRRDIDERRAFMYKDARGRVRYSQFRVFRFISAVASTNPTFEGVKL